MKIDDGRAWPVQTTVVRAYFLANLGVYALVPVLGRLLADHASAGPGLAGIGLSAFFGAAGVAALLVNPILPRVSYRTGMATGVGLSICGFGLLTFAREPVFVVGLLVVAGAGMSTHVLLGRVLVAESMADDVERNRAYSALAIAINLAGAFGPFVASALYRTTRVEALLTAVVVCHAVSMAILLRHLPPALRPQASAVRWPLSKVTIGRIARDSRGIRTMVLAFVTTFVYAQFYSAFALSVAKELDSAFGRALLLSGPAIAIVIGQRLITARVGRRLARGTAPVELLAWSGLAFAAAVLILGVGLPFPVAAGAAVAMFAAAEMVFTPIMSTAFAALPTESKLEAMNLRGISWTIAESSGSFIGGTVFLALRTDGHGHVYWLVLATAGAVITLVAWPRRQRATPPGPAAQPRVPAPTGVKP
ncbi:MAG TPA: MFS transporter [Acidimicrobiales bacterium]|nr:MFS transporter [Acidimicrobiales bacterium]